MADIDMIPRAYRDGVRVRRVLRRTGMALALVAAAGVLGGAGLRWRTAALERDIAALQASATQAQADSARDAQQQAERMRREQERAILRTLRRAGELTALARGLDAALADGVWLTELRVERDVQALSGTPGAATGAAAGDPAANDGVEAFTAPGAGPAADAQTWHLRSGIELSGQAASYGAVTDFLSALGRQPGIAGLRLVSSNAGADGGTIDFRATGALTQQGTPP